MRIVFMGTPEFAVPSLRILYEAGYTIPAVITGPDRMGGRGRKQLIESPVKRFALEKNLNVLQPTNLKSEAFQEELRALKADLQVVVAFRMLPASVWDMPPLGTYNLHGSLLPRYRGAAPINWAVIRGEKTTGVTSFKLRHEIDTGSILLQREMPILHEDTATDVHNRMMFLAADLVLETVQIIESGKTELKEQDDSQVSQAPKLTKENTKIDFNKNAEEVYNFIRGLSLYPAAWFDLKGQPVKIYRSEVLEAEHELKPGTILTDNKQYIHIACGSGKLNVLELKYPGKRKMNTAEFLNGFDLKSALEDAD